MFATEIKRKRAQQLRAFSKWKWHVDEVFVKVNGQRHYLLRAVDNEGEVLETVVNKRRKKAAALKLLKKMMKRHGIGHAVFSLGFAASAVLEAVRTEREASIVACVANSS